MHLQMVKGNRHRVNSAHCYALLTSLKTIDNPAIGDRAALGYIHR